MGTIPKLWTPRPDPEDDLGCQFPKYPGEMMMTDEKTVSNENGFQTFFKRGFGLLFSTQVGNVECDRFMFHASLPFQDCATCCHVGYGILMLFCSHCPMMAQRWKAEKPCLSMKLHLAEGKQQDMVKNDYIASLPIEGKLRVFHALVWMA